MNGEIIICAAIKLRPSGKIYSGHRHHDCFKAAYDAGEKVPRDEIQGFLTGYDNRFVNREEAAQIALEAGQIEKLKYHSTRLFSEDLY